VPELVEGTNEKTSLRGTKQSHAGAFLLSLKFVIPRNEESLRVSDECDSSFVGMTNSGGFYCGENQTKQSHAVNPSSVHTVVGLLRSSQRLDGGFMELEFGEKFPRSPE